MSRAAKAERDGRRRMKEPDDATRSTADGWVVDVRRVRLTCPQCGVSVEVVSGCSGWCTRCKGRPQLEEGAT
jgi:hypothetical protein